MLHYRSVRVYSQNGGEATRLVRLTALSCLVSVDEGAKCFNVLQISARIVVGCFQNEGCVFQFRVPGNAAQSLATDVALANVPMSIDARVVRSARIIEVNRPDVADSDRATELFNQGFQTMFFTDVVTCSKCVGGIETNTEREFRARIHDFFQMFKAMADTVALTRRVLEQNTKRTQPQSLAGYFQTFGALRNTISFARASRTTRMNDQIIDAQQDRPLNFFAKGGPRFFEHSLIRSREVNQ